MDSRTAILTKQRELEAVYELQLCELQAELSARDQILTEAAARQTALLADFTFNLDLIAERDNEVISCRLLLLRFSSMVISTSRIDTLLCHDFYQLAQFEISFQDIRSTLHCREEEVVPSQNHVHLSYNRFACIGDQLSEVRTRLASVAAEQEAERAAHAERINLLERRIKVQYQFTLFSCLSLFWPHASALNSSPLFHATFDQE